MRVGMGPSSCIDVTDFEDRDSQTAAADDFPTHETFLVYNLVYY